MSAPQSTETVGHIRAVFDQIALDYDEVYLYGLEARVFGYVTWKHLLPVLPEEQDALILDAGGGTGRWTLPLAKLGYRVTLCDISPGMLGRAEEKLRAAGLLGRVEIKTEDIASMSFVDERFDFVMCEDGPFSISPDTEKAAAELVRVLKRGGRLWTGGVGRYHVQYKDTDTRVFAVQELEGLFEQKGVTIEKKYGYRLVTQAFPPDYAVQAGRMVKSGPQYEEGFIEQLAQLELVLSEKPALLEMAEYIQILGKKR